MHIKINNIHILGKVMKWCGQSRYSKKANSEIV